jgi:hypothetical protein
VPPDPEEEAYQRKVDAAHAKRHITFVFAVVVALAIAGYVLSGSIQRSPVNYKERAETFRVEVQDINIDAVRKWMATLPAQYLGQMKFPTDLAREVPLKKYSLNWDGKSLTIHQGNGFGHYGLCIPPEGQPVPESTSREYRLPLKEGAYVFHEIQ